MSIQSKMRRSARTSLQEFRWILGGLTLIWGILTAWLASHQSETPSYFNRYSEGYLILLSFLLLILLLLVLSQLSPVCKVLHRVRYELMLVFVSCTICFLVVESSVRLIDPLGISYFHYSSLFDLDHRESDPELYYKLKSNYESNHGVLVRTNEMGLRERPLLQKVPGEYRIAFLGDSVTFGAGVPVERAFPRRLEEIIGDRIGLNVRTINTGVGGYNTLQEWRFLERYGQRLAADLLVLLYVPNDVEVNGPMLSEDVLSFSNKSPPQVIRQLLGELWLFRIVAFLGKVRSYESASANTGSRGWNDSMDALERIAVHASQSHTEFVVFFWGGPTTNQLEDQLWKAISGIGMRERFPVFDMRPWWQGYEWPALTISVIDSHPNMRGHDLIAEEMYARLLTLGVFSR